MALNTSGPISLAGATAGESIAVELAQSATGTIALNDANVRTLAGVPTGAIVMPTNFYGKSNTVAFGAIEYTTAGTYTFTVPAEVTEICAVCIGGGAANQEFPTLSGGGAGALSYSNGVATTPGESLTVVVGVGGVAPVGLSGAPAGPGGDSYITRGATTLLLAKGGPFIGGAGSGFTPGGLASGGVGAVRYSGGSQFRNIGVGGAGAAGYAADGATGNNGTGINGSGGGGGSGAGSPNQAGRGGGTGLVVQGANGVGGVAPGASATAGSGGSGQLYGGGGGNHGDGGTVRGTSGGNGGVRIIYGGTGKTYPNNSAP